MAVLRQAREQTTPIYIEVMNAFDADFEDGGFDELVSSKSASFMTSI
jgi:hypothetical protein